MNAWRGRPTNVFVLWSECTRRLGAEQIPTRQEE